VNAVKSVLLAVCPPFSYMHVARERNDNESSRLSIGHVTSDGSEVKKSIQFMHHLINMQFVIQEQKYTNRSDIVLLYNDIA